MKVLITGSRGYIGSKLCEMTFKLKSDIKIYGLDTDFYRKNNKKFEISVEYLLRLPIKIIQ